MIGASGGPNKWSARTAIQIITCDKSELDGSPVEQAIGGPVTYRRVGVMWKTRSENRHAQVFPVPRPRLASRSSGPNTDMQITTG